MNSGAGQGNRVNGKLTICAGLPAFSLSSLKEGGEETKFGSEAGSRFTRLPCGAGTVLSPSLRAALATKRSGAAARCLRPWIAAPPSGGPQ
jgi:hypothetical protein